MIQFTLTDSVAHMMSVLKANSSRWVHETYGMRFFEWQRSYAAFSVSQSVLGKVEKYIATQEEHHKKKTYREELTKFFRANGIDADTFKAE